MVQSIDHRNARRFLIILVVLTGLALGVSALLDVQVTAALHRHEWPALAQIMGRTLFEGEKPGANDALALLLMAALGLYLWGCLRPHRTRLSALRPQAGFVLIAVLVVAFLLMQVIKLSQGRARPDLVFNHGWPFTHWFAIGPHFIGDGLFRGAFPSGHTAQAFSSMSVAYALYCDPCANRKIRLLGLGWGMVVVCLSLLMGLARCMSLSHWFSDVIAAIGLGWIVLHAIYFHLLLVPAQRIYFKAHGRHPHLPAFWELRLGGWLAVLTVGVLFSVNGLRALLLAKTVWLAYLVPVGLALIYGATRNVIRLRRLLVSGLAAPATRD